MVQIILPECKFFKTHWLKIIVIVVMITFMIANSIFAGCVARAEHQGLIDAYEEAVTERESLFDTVQDQIDEETDIERINNLRNELNATPTLDQKIEYPELQQKRLDAHEAREALLTFEKDFIASEDHFLNTHKYNGNTHEYYANPTYKPYESGIGGTYNGDATSGIFMGFAVGTSALAARASYKASWQKSFYTALFLFMFALALISGVAGFIIEDQNQYFLYYSQYVAYAVFAMVIATQLSQMYSMLPADNPIKTRAKEIGRGFQRTFTSITTCFRSANEANANAEAGGNRKMQLDNIDTYATDATGASKGGERVKRRLRRLLDATRA